MNLQSQKKIKDLKKQLLGICKKRDFYSFYKNNKDMIESILKDFVENPNVNQDYTSFIDCFVDLACKYNLKNLQAYIDYYLIHIERYYEKIIFSDHNIFEHKDFYNNYLKKCLKIDNGYIYFPCDFIINLKKKKCLISDIVCSFLSDVEDFVNNIIVDDVKKSLPTNLSLEKIYVRLSKFVEKNGKGEISDKCVSILDIIHQYEIYFPRKKVSKEMVDNLFKDFFNHTEMSNFDNTKIIEFEMKNIFIEILKKRNKKIDVKNGFMDFDFLNIPLSYYVSVSNKYYNNFGLSEEEYDYLISVFNTSFYKIVYDMLVSKNNSDVVKNMFLNNISKLNDPIVQIGKNILKIERLIIQISEDGCYDDSNKSDHLIEICNKYHKDVVYSLFFVYFVMYDKNGLNAKNKFSHGYYFGDHCYFDMVCTFFCINELERIKEKVENGNI